MKKCDGCKDISDLKHKQKVSQTPNDVAYGGTHHENTYVFCDSDVCDTMLDSPSCR